jgi:hypothetical protein
LVVRVNNDQGTATCSGSGGGNIGKYFSFVRFVEADIVEGDVGGEERGRDDGVAG